MQKLLERQMTRKEFLAFSGFAIAVIFGIAGTIKELASHAASPTANAEPENGTLAGTASVVMDSQASGAKAVQFGSVSPGGRPTGARYITYESLWHTGMNLRDVIALVPAGKVLTLPEGLFQLSDFTMGSGRYMLQLPLNSGIVGSGRNTIIEMVANTSTQAGGQWDPAQSTSNGTTVQTTNQLYLIRMEGTDCILSNFHLRGTAQSPGTSTAYPNGHNYNGVYQINCTNPVSEDLYITGIPGDNTGPPGETFGYNNYNSTGLIANRMEVSGIREADGVVVGATGIGDNNASGSVFTDCTVHDNWTGSWAFWQSHDITTKNATVYHNGSAGTAHGAHGINHERSYNMTHINPNISIGYNGNLGYHMSWNSDLPAYNGYLKVVNPTYNSDARLPNRFIVMSFQTYRGVSNIYQKVVPYTVNVYKADGVTPLPQFAYAN